jgi:hypothetical protein
VDTKKNANGREEKDQPRRNQPSREAMARKLQIYADEEACWRLAFGVRRVGVLAIRGALPRLRGPTGWRRVGGFGRKGTE